MTTHGLIGIVGQDKIRELAQLAVVHSMEQIIPLYHETSGAGLFTALGLRRDGPIRGSYFTELATEEFGRAKWAQPWDQLAYSMAEMTGRAGYSTYEINCLRRDLRKKGEPEIYGSVFVDPFICTTAGIAPYNNQLISYIVAAKMVALTLAYIGQPYWPRQPTD